MSSDPTFDQLLVEAQQVQTETGDKGIVAYINQLKSTREGLETLLDHKIDDPTKKLREGWDEMAKAADKLLKQIDEQQRARSDALKKSTNKAANGRNPQRSAGKDVPIERVQVLPGVPDFAAAGEQVKALQKQSDKNIDDVGRGMRQFGNDVRDVLSTQVQVLGANARRMRWMLRRMRLSRLASGAIAAGLSVMAFLALYGLLLWLHHPVAEYAQEMMRGTWTAFGLLALLLLPIELAKAYLIEPRIHSWLHRREQTRTSKEFDKLIMLLALTRIAIARAKA